MGAIKEILVPDIGDYKDVPGVEMRFPMREWGWKIDDVTAYLARRGVNELHVEAGQQLNGSLLTAGLVDEMLVYLAPRMLGPGRGMAAFGPLERLADGLSLEFIECSPVGPDLRIRARLAGRTAAAS
jgi:diaminohydroxyphosphoribosylaminopyrimidine deaminase/5-amino-6-(5-phosphoribosylamino)uracil reductase